MSDKDREKIHDTDEPEKKPKPSDEPITTQDEGEGGQTSGGGKNPPPPPDPPEQP